MRTFACSVCRRLVTFESTSCLHCGARLAFAPDRREIVAVRAQDDGSLRERSQTVDQRWACANAEVADCNWLAEGEGKLCRSCALTRTRPADGDLAGLARLTEAEAAKRRLLFELGELGLPLPLEAHDDGLRFDLLSSENTPVMTGHASGLVTLDLAESDPAHRVKLREQMDEPYRTLIGHFRHEVGHWFYGVIVAGTPVHDEARSLFGDETEDYGEALDRHYANGAPDDWNERHVSAYATMHPDEDWAETFAHYLHLWDTLQTAAAYRVRVDGPEGVSDPQGVSAGAITAPRVGSLREQLGAQWLPLTYALNELSRSLGDDDLYPFVLPGPVVDKLDLVDRAVADAAARAALGA